MRRQAKRDPQYWLDFIKYMRAAREREKKAAENQPKGATGQKP